MNGQRKLLLSLSVAILLFLSIGYWGIKPERIDYPAYLSFSPDKDGIKAFRLLLEKKGKAAKEWRQSWRFLPQEQGQALLVIEPGPLQPGEQEAIMDWVAEGNDLILFQQDPELTELFTIEYTAEPDTLWSDVEVMEPEDGGIEKASVETDARLLGDDDITALLADEYGILAARKEVGAGSVTLFLTPEWLQNENILEHGHFELLWPYLQGAYTAVWFDEFHHGYQQQPGLLAVYPEWLLFITVQIALALLLWIWWKGKRFGPVYTLREWVVRRGDETMLAVAGWYERRRLAKDACRHQEQYLRRLFQEKWGLPAAASDQEVVRAAKNRWDDHAVSRLGALLKRLQDIQTEKRYGGAELIRDSKWIDEIISRLEKE
ncbi:DUF4350 domain-containing protein [Brevibacillus migulae]|uniref:DUF4350 domain-containing protein n=1 Tax=Brevibacillus migulae TaxID=1644114 RepID=UPI00106E0322|nr:DUF4350 domain-containing protein [Brevibacillus migulae]